MTRQAEAGNGHIMTSHDLILANSPIEMLFH